MVFNLGILGLRVQVHFLAKGLTQDTVPAI